MRIFDYWKLCGQPAFWPSQLLSAQDAKPKPEPDVLVFADGERLVGHFEQSNGTSVKFKSDVVGDVTVDWSKVKELHTSQEVRGHSEEASN